MSSGLQSKWQHPLFAKCWIQATCTQATEELDLERKLSENGLMRGAAAEVTLRGQVKGWRSVCGCSSSDRMLGVE